MMSCPREGALHPLNVDEGPGDRVHIKSGLYSLHTVPRNIADELPPEGAVLSLDGHINIPNPPFRNIS